MKKSLFLLIVCILFLTGCQSQDPTNGGEKGQEVTQAELANADGKDGNQCFVAVSGRVYEIKGSSLWVNGEHTESEGEASCGRDLTSVIRRSPHGVSIFTTSPKVSQIGTLVD